MLLAHIEGTEPTMPALPQATAAAANAVPSGASKSAIQARVSSGLVLARSTSCDSTRPRAVICMPGSLPIDSDFAKG